MYWNSGEPNNSGTENFGEIYSTGTFPGKWNDLQGGVFTLSGYVVEYGGMAGDPVIVLNASKNVDVVSQSSVSATVGAGGTLDTSFRTSPQMVTYNGTTSFKFDANSGYHLTGISGCGGTPYSPVYTNGISGAASYTYTTGLITNDCTVSATVAINQFDITATPDTHSYITGYTLNTPHTYGNIDYNATQSVTFNSDIGYHLTGITNSCSGTVSAPYSNAVNGPWTASATFTPSGTITNGVAANCGISAVSAINVYSITPSVVIVP
jgi:hypothetical protein